VATERRRLSFAQFAQVNLVGAKIDNLGGDFTAAPVEKDDFIAALQPEHIARVMRFRPGQTRRGGTPIFGRDVKAMHGHYNCRFQIADSAQASRCSIWNRQFEI